MSLPHLALLTVLALTGCSGGSSDKADDTGGTDSGETGDTGESGETATAPDSDHDGSPDSEDCAPTNSGVHPGAPEVCNTIDDDCDMLVDEADPDLQGGDTFYVDDDGDGYGGTTTTVACEAGAGMTETSEDCNDADPWVNPESLEVCNGYDDDCNGLTDEEDPDIGARPVWFQDYDGDGYGDPDEYTSACELPEGYAENHDDCNDRNDEVNPDAQEVCDGQDNDCDDLIDADDDSAIGETLYEDLDGDGHGTADVTMEGCHGADGWATVADDCNDANARAYPGAAEYCNSVDDDCDGTTDESTAVDAMTWYYDGDNDNYGVASPTTMACSEPANYASNTRDCDDTDASVHPGASDDPADGVDSNCDGSNDYDGDGDGYVLDEWASASGLPGGDCDDGDDTIHPGASELCDDLDNNCDGAVDEGTPVDAPTWYLDADADGYGVPDSTTVACDQPAGYCDNPDDCDDADPAMLDTGCSGGYGGHRIDKDGNYYYALYNDRGFGIMGARDWYGSSDRSSAPEGVTWSPDQTILYYNDLAGNVFAQTEPFGSTSTLIGTFGLGQIGGGVVDDSYYYVGDYSGGNIYAMDLSTGRYTAYSSLGGACKPYFGNSAMAIDDDGAVYAASSCGIVRYEPGGTATDLAPYSNLISAVAMDADQELYGMDYSGRIIHFDKSTGVEISHITMAVTPSTTWTLAVDANGDFVVNYWGEQRIFSHVDGHMVMEWSASSYYPGSSGYYWYVTF